MPRFRPRISLLSALLLMTIVGMAIVCVQLWREVAPLRAENRRLRTEVGYLTIDDPKKAYAIEVSTSDNDSWRWRIYLPPGGTYSLHERSGHLPARSKHPGNAWFDALMKSGSGSSSSGSSLQAEFTLEARLEQEEDGWILATQYKTTDSNSATASKGRTSIYQPSGDWLSDRRSRPSTSDVSASKQRSFKPGEPILLLHVMRPVIKETPGGGFSSTMPEGAAEGFVLWIEEEQAAPPAKGKMP